MFHLIHPAAVHFSVAFIVLGGVCEFTGMVRGIGRVARYGELMLFVGAASLVPTLVSGYLAANTVPIPEGGHEFLADHERNGWFLLLALVAGLFWKGWNRGTIPAGQRGFYLVLLLVTLTLAIYSAWLGGQMVFELGIGVMSG